MRSQLGAFALLVASLLPNGCLGQLAPSKNITATPEDVLAAIPKCAVSCLTSAVEKSSCSVADLGCICSSAAIQNDASNCILAACNLPDALMAKNVSSVACQWPIRDRALVYSDMSISLGSITVVFVLIRLIFKYFFSPAGSLGPDDKIIMGTLALRISCILVNVRGLAAHGMGRDVWTMAPHEVTNFVIFLYIMEILYLAELSFIKLSLSVFYVYIFPGTTMRRLLWGTVIFNILFGVVFVITAIFQCSPVSYYWTQYVEHTSGHCVNINTFGWTNAALSLTVDIWMIALPLSQVPRLNLHWKKKIGVAVMFLTGIFVTIVSILRLKSVLSFANSTNPTWDQWDIAFWSTIEVNVAMICTCLPTVRMILLRIFPKLFSSDNSRNKSYGPAEVATSFSRRSRQLSGKDVHHLSDLEPNKEHTWTRLGKGNHITEITAGKEEC